MNIRDALDDPRRQFWLLQLGGWTAWGLFGKYLYTRLLLEATPPGYAIYVSLITVLAVLLTLLLRQLYRWSWTQAAWARALAFLCGSYLAAWTWISLRSQIYARWFEHDAKMDQWLARLGDAAELYHKVTFYDGQVSSWFLMLSWSALYFALKYYRVFGEIRQDALKSAAMAHEAQLKMLRYQLNPHFLFNTLNAISTLILEQHTEAANRMVTRLSSFLRYSLDNDPMQRVSLRQELEALQLYLDIEKVRFEERLQLSLDIEPQARLALIPSLLLQPLVENAIKHGIAQAEEGGHLHIAARVFAGELLLQLSDDGPGVELVDGDIPAARGVGLRNTRERLQALYGASHSLRLSRTEPHGLTVNIRIPLQTEHAP
jgi:two-component system, LytTR family, sensor kinase